MVKPKILYFFLCASLLLPQSAWGAGSIDNFENDKAITDQFGATDGAWASFAGTKYTLSAESTRTFFSKASIRVDFNFTNDAFQHFRISDLDSSPNTSNFSADTFFTMRVYGADTFICKLKTDTDAESSDLIPDTVTSNNAWTLVTFKYNTSLNGINPAKIKYILFFAKISANVTASGTFYMDNLWVGYGYPKGPDTVTDLLAVPGPKNGQVRLSWTAIGNDNGLDRVQQYLIRSSTSSLTNAAFDALTNLTGIPAPSAAGTLDSMVVSNLTAGQTYYFAIKCVDTGGATDSLSAVAQSAPLSSTAGLLLFDDFTDGYTKPNKFGKDVGQWSSGGATIFPATASSANSFGNIGGALDIVYNTAAGECGYYTQLGDTDLSAYRGISFQVRGAAGGEDFLIGIKTAVSGGESKLRIRSFLTPGRITAGWQKVVIPFTSFPKLDPSAVSSTNTTNPLTKIENVSFTFNTSTTSSAGEVFIDEIVFVKSVPQVFCEDFDRTADPSAGTNAGGGNTGNLGNANSYTQQADSSARLSSTAANDGVFITMLEFGDSTGQGDKPTQILEASHISFYAKGNAGGETLEVNLQDAYGQEYAVKVKDALGAALPAAWTKIAIPLSLFPRVDMTNLNAVHFRLGAAGQVVFIDSIVFADSSVPTTPSNLMLNGAAAAANAAISSRNVLTVTADAGSTDASMQEVRFEYSTDAGSTWNTIGIDQDVADNSYQAIWVTRNLTGAPAFLGDGDFLVENQKSKIKNLKSPFFPAAVAINLSFRAVAVDVAGNTSTTAAVASSAVTPASVVVYPNPYYPLQGGTMKITNLSAGATVNIYTLAGELVVQLVDSDNDGQVEWKGINKGSDRVASGLYLYEARLTSTTARGKIVVIK